MEISGFVYCHNIVAAGLSLFCEILFHLYWFFYNISFKEMKLRDIHYMWFVNNVDNYKRIFVIFQIL